MERVSKCGIDEIILATGGYDINFPLISLVESSGFKWFSGSENFILDRYYECAKLYNITDIIRICGDSPLIDFKIINSLIELYQKSNADYASNLFPSTYPYGMAVEMFSFSSLRRAYETANNGFDRSNLLILHNKFKCVNLINKKDLSYIKVALDYDEDLKLLNYLDSKYGIENISVEFLDRIYSDNPDCFNINRGLKRRTAKEDYERITQTEK